MNTTLYKVLHVAFGFLALVTVFILYLMTHPVVHLLVDEIVPVH